METKLRIVPGAGKEIDVDPGVAAGYQGTVGQVIRQIVRDHIRDPHLLRMLDDPEVNLEQYSEAADGSGHEATLSAQANWSEVVEGLRQQTVEIGLARNHVGGRREEGQRPLQLPNPPKCVTYGRHQRTAEHDASYELTAEDLSAVARGKAVFITGRALAKAEFLCHVMGSQEILWYWTGERGAEGLITDLILPEQLATAGMCASAGHDVLRVNRQARKLGRRIVAAGHSHGCSDVFSSGTDKQLMSALARERVGHASYVRKTAAGKAAEAPQATPQGCQFEATFPDLPGTTARIATTHPDLRPEELDVQLVTEAQGMTVTFSTHNVRGEHYFPVHRVKLCPACQARDEATRPAEEVALHVVGPQELSADEREALRKEAKSKVQRGYLWDGAPKGHPWDEREPEAGGLADEEGEAGIREVGENAAADFEVYRRGNRVGRIPAALLEEAACRTPALAAALGWNEYAHASQEATDGAEQPD